MMAGSSNRYLAWSYKMLLLVSIVDFADLQSACSSAAEIASIPAALHCFNNEVVSAPRLILDVFDVKQSTSSECRCRVTSDMNTTVTLSAYQGMNAADDCDSTLLVNVAGTFSAINCFISGSYVVDGAEMVLTFIKPVYNYNADYCILMTSDNSAKLTMKCDGDPLPSTPITQLSTTLMSTSTAAQSTTLMSTSTAAQSTTLMSTSTAAQSTTLKATTTSVSATTTMSSPPISSFSSMTSIKTSQFETTVMSTSTNSPTTQQQNTFQTSSAHDSTTQSQTTVQTTSAHYSTSKLQTDVPSDKTTSHQMSTTPLEVTTTAFTSSTKSSASSSRPSSVSSFTAILSSTGDTTSNAQTTQTTSASTSEQSVSSLPTSTFSNSFTDESSVVSTTHAGSTTVTPQISTTTPRRITTPSEISVSNTNDDIEWSWVIPLIGGGIIIITGIVIGCCYCYRKENSKPPEGEDELHDGYQDKAFINYAYDVEDPEFTGEVNSAFVVDEPVNQSNTKSTLPGINTIILDAKEDISDSTNKTRGTFIRYNVKEYPKTQLYASVNKPANQHIPVNTIVNEPTTVYAGINKSNNTDVPMYAAIDHNKTNPPYIPANRVSVTRIFSKKVEDLL